jgi:hypothetical protein
LEDGRADQVVWDDIFEKLQSDRPSTPISEQVKGAMKKVEILHDVLKSNLEDDTVLMKMDDLATLSDDPFLRAIKDKSLLSEMRKILGDGRKACSIFPATTPYSPCVLHVKINFVSRVFVSMVMALADMQDREFSECSPDIARGGKAFTKLEAEFKAKGVHLVQKSRYSKRKAGERHLSQRVRQMHGGDLARKIMNVKVAFVFSDGTKQRSDNRGSCPNLQDKVKFAAVFTRALFWTTSTVNPCRFFSLIPGLTGCRTYKEEPVPENELAVCRKQADFVDHIAAGLGRAMDMLVAPWRQSKGKCVGWQSVSAHLWIQHIPDLFRAGHCQTLPSAASAEAQHQETKNCAKQTGRSGDKKNALLDSNMQALLCGYHRGMSDVGNEAFVKSKLDTERVRQKREDTKWEGSVAVLRAYHYLHKWNVCKDNNEGVRIGETGHAHLSSGITFTRTVENADVCDLHNEMHYRYRERPDYSSYDKSHEPRLSACLEYYDSRQGDEESAPPLDVNTFFNPWHQFMDKVVMRPVAAEAAGRGAGDAREAAQEEVRDGDEQVDEEDDGQIDDDDYDEIQQALLDRFGVEEGDQAEADLAL